MNTYFQLVSRNRISRIRFRANPEFPASGDLSFNPAPIFFKSGSVIPQSNAVNTIPIALSPFIFKSGKKISHIKFLWTQCDVILTEFSQVYTQFTSMVTQKE